MAKPKKTAKPALPAAPSITTTLLQTEIASLTNQIRHHEKSIQNSTAVIQQAHGALMLAQSLLAQLQGVNLKEPDVQPPGKTA